MQALAELPLLAAALVCLGLAAILVLLVYALFHGLIDILNLIPKVNIGTAWLDGVKNAVWHALGVAYHGIDKLVGWQFHQLARLIGLVWREFKAHATVIAEAAATLAGLGLVVAAVRALVHHLTRTSSSSAAQVKHLRRELTHVEHQIRALEREVRVGIGEDVLPRLKTLDREVARINHKTIPAIEAADAQAESAISDLWTWVHKHVLVAGTASFAGAVAIALSALGLEGLRCPGFLRLLSKRGCGLGGLLDALLGLAISALALENVCRLLPILEAAFGEVVGPVIHLLTEVPLGGCEKPPKGWATLSVAVGPLPPAQVLGAFPA